MLIQRSLKTFKQFRGPLVLKLAFNNPNIYTLDGTARYVGKLLAPAKGFGLWPRLFWPSAKSLLAYSQRIELWAVRGIQEVPKGLRGT